jgi:DNA end-binding protein Ku
MKELAEVIIDREAGHFDPTKFEDRYENPVIDLLKSKEAGLSAPVEKPEPRPHNVINIMDALQRSSDWRVPRTSQRGTLGAIGRYTGGFIVIGNSLAMWVTPSGNMGR